MATDVLKEPVSLLVIVGPTASGKSALALQLAQKYDGEIICADSQTIRRDMNIGTAKPSSTEKQLVRHHLLDIIGPYDSYSVADFKQAALAAIADITARGKLPILVGGTGLYVDAVIFDFSFANPPDPVEREALSQKTVEELQALHQAQGIPLPYNDRNKRHLIRSLESGGLKAPDKTLRPGTLILGIDPPKEVLEERIMSRVETMLATGFGDEIKQIIKTYGQPPEAWDAIGYKMVAQWLESPEPLNLEDIRTALITATRQYAKRQLTWFKRNKSIYWASDEASALALAANWLMEASSTGQKATTTSEL